MPKRRIFLRQGNGILGIRLKDIRCRPYRHFVQCGGRLGAGQLRWLD